MNDSPGDPFAHGWNSIPAADHGYLSFFQENFELSKALIPANPNGSGTWWAGLNVLKYVTPVDDDSYWWISLKVSHSISPIYGLNAVQGPVIGGGQAQTFGIFMPRDGWGPWTVWVELTSAESFVVDAGPDTTEGDGSTSATFSISASKKEGGSASWSTTQTYATKDTVVSLAQEPTKATWNLEFPNTDPNHEHGASPASLTSTHDLDLLVKSPASAPLTLDAGAIFTPFEFNGDAVVPLFAGVWAAPNIQIE
jgi:hypothetical protein